MTTEKKRMRTLSICNLKGGVGKTTTTVNLAGILATEFEKKVLVVDNDQQGNTSQFFGVFDIGGIGTAEVLCLEYSIKELIKHTNNPNVDVLTGNMNIAAANRQLMVESGGMPREIRLREALKEIQDEYDFCIIDNGPNLEFSFDNSIVAADDFMIPVKIDKYAFYGVKFILKRVQNLKKYYNDGINFMGCLVTMQHNSSQLEREGEQWLAEGHSNTEYRKYKMLSTKIKYSPRVNDSTFSSDLITVSSVRSLAAKNYRALAAEYLEEIEQLKKQIEE